MGRRSWCAAASESMSRYGRHSRLGVGPRAPCALAAAAVVLALVSCATTPPPGVSPQRYLAALPQDGSAYVALDMEHTRDLVAAVAGELGLPVPTGRMEAGLKRASTVYAAVGGVGGVEGAFSALVVGRFPTVGLGLTLKARDGWKRVRGTPVRYENATTGLVMAVLEPGVLALARGGPGVVSLETSAHTQAGLSWDLVLDLARAGDLVVFVPRPPAFLAEIGGPVAASVRTLWLRVRREAVSAQPHQTPLTADLGVELAGEREARLFRPVLRLALTALVRRSLGGASALADVREENEGGRLVLSGIRLTLEQALQVVRVLRPEEGSIGG
jgi:hypothetical protein